MSNERELTKNMKDILKRNGIVASLKDYEARKDSLIAINASPHNVLDFIPDFIMIDLLKEFDCGFSGYQNIDEFAEGVLGYKHGNVQVMRTIARHFFIFNTHTKEFELDYNFKDYSSTQLEKMAKWSKQELLNADINPSMTVYEIDAEVRKNGLKKSIRVTDDEYKVIEAYSVADDSTKDKIKELLKLQ
ncbi:hypothetical protein D6856_02540 [Butyrivibrio sp. XB500-5]|uniref:hypothetical protein n=1 Tax=Butyrivibrio sp. XB500-5 TaxID=2364880 RepID=UPI000EA936B6|nr:hypothetical protein [Butyrivibrio sp. XB500-5]RKM63019.1 hypothetical protein D6856_02540 [Butyrivibrio sp. XB500-5]